MKSLCQLSILTLFFTISTGEASVLKSFCYTDQLDFNIKKTGAHVMSYCFKTKDEFFGSSAEVQAQKVCQEWSNFLQLERPLKVKSFVSDFTTCSYEAHKHELSLTPTHTDVPTHLYFTRMLNFYGGSGRYETDLIYAEGGSTRDFIAGRLFVDDGGALKPTAVYDENGEEKTRWIIKNNKVYCGKVDGDIAFSSTEEGMYVTFPTSAPEREAFYKEVQRDQMYVYYAAEKMLNGLNAEFLKTTRRGGSQQTYTFYNSGGASGTGDIVAEFKTPYHALQNFENGSKERDCEDF